MGRRVSRGSGRCRFSAVRYTSNEPRVTGHPFTDGPLEVSVQIEASEPTEIGRLAVMIYDYYGTKLINADVCATAGNLRLRGGSQAVKMKIDALHLKPGLYRLGLSLSDEIGAHLDLIDTGIEFEVVSASGDPRPPVDGLVPCSIHLATQS